MAFAKSLTRDTKVKRKSSFTPALPVKLPKGMTQDQFEEIRTSFNCIDENGDGRLSKAELLKAICMLGLNPTDKEIEEYWQEADANRDGFISFEEYINVMKDNYKSIDIEKERMKTAFATLDRNKDGVISLDEFRWALTYKNSNVNLEEIDSFFREVDLDGDGIIDYQEFVESKLCSKAFS